jgi:plasmid stabilization system protein ParE
LNSEKTARWYRERSPDVARRFLQEVRALAKVVARVPFRFPVLVEPALDPPIRRALVPGFPYALVFVVGQDVVHVLAVAHQHRMPGYWLQRLAQKR